MFFTGRMSFVTPNHQCQCTKGNWLSVTIYFALLNFLTSLKRCRQLTAVVDC